MTLTSATFFGPWDSIAQTSQWKQRKHETGTTDGQLLHHSHRKKPTRRGKNKPQTATLISMHVLRLLNFILIGHYTINLSEWNKIVHRKYTKRLSCLHWKKKKKRKAKTSHFALFRFSRPYSGSFQSHSGSFQYISVSFRLVPVHSGSILVHSLHSGVILRRSGIFRPIPVYSVPFHSVPVFSNAQWRVHKYA